MTIRRFHTRPCVKVAACSIGCFVPTSPISAGRTQWWVFVRHSKGYVGLLQLRSFVNLPSSTIKPARHAGCDETLADRRAKRRTKCLSAKQEKQHPILACVQKKILMTSASHMSGKKKQTRSDENSAPLFLFFLIYNNLEHVWKESGMESDQLLTLPSDQICRCELSINQRLLLLSNLSVTDVTSLVFLTLYAPCIILRYVYDPIRCTKFLWLDFIFH